MNNKVWTGEKKEKTIDSSDLKTRLNLNKKYQSKDFQSWLRKRLAVKTGENILDVGCGTGAQTFFMAEDIGEEGHIDSFDISSKSIDTLKTTIPEYLKSRVSAHALDMADISKFFSENDINYKYSLAHSSYAIYYSPQRIKVISEMQKKIDKSGRLAIFTPCPSHGMIDFASKFHEIPEQVYDNLNFGEFTLRPLFRKCFWEVEVHYFQSELRIKSAEDFFSFYKATTYFTEDSSESIYKAAKEIINKNGSLNFQKSGILLISSGLRRLANEI